MSKLARHTEKLLPTSDDIEQLSLLRGAYAEAATSDLAAFEAAKQLVKASKITLPAEIVAFIKANGEGQTSFSQSVVASLTGVGNHKNIAGDEEVVSDTLELHFPTIEADNTFLSLWITSESDRSFLALPWHQHQSQASRTTTIGVDTYSPQGKRVESHLVSYTQSTRLNAGPGLEVRPPMSFAATESTYLPKNWSTSDYDALGDGFIDQAAEHNAFMQDLNDRIIPLAYAEAQSEPSKRNVRIHTETPKKHAATRPKAANFETLSHERAFTQQAEKLYRALYEAADQGIGNGTHFCIDVPDTKPPVVIEGILTTRPELPQPVIEQQPKVTPNETHTRLLHRRPAPVKEVVSPSVPAVIINLSEQSIVFNSIVRYKHGMVDGPTPNAGHITELDSGLQQLFREISQDQFAKDAAEHGTEAVHALSRALILVATNIIDTPGISSKM